VRAVTLIAVVVAVAAAALAAWRYGAGRLDGVVASTVERYGSAVTGTAVEVDDVDLTLTSGLVDLAGVTVGNPRGYDTEYAVRMGSAAVALDIGSLAGAVPVVKELTVDGVLINAEQRGVASNLTDIQQHATASPGDAAAGEPGRIVIERFRVRNARVLLTSEHLSQPEELTLRDVVVDNIGSATGGATYSEAAEAMLMPVLAVAGSAATERLRSAAGEAVSEAAREELEEEAEELRQRADAAEQDLSEKVEELLDRD
jgi:hypothetical protein